MFKRKIETHHDNIFQDAEAVRRYAADAEKSTMKYQAFLRKCRALHLQGRALDVGAGPGVVAALLATENPHLHITALDISPLMIEAGKSYIQAKNLSARVDFVEGDVENAAFLTTLGTFDFIYCTYVFHHWPEPKPIIQRLMSMLNPHGVLYLYDLRRAWWLYWVPRHDGFFMSIRAAFVAEEVRAMLNELNMREAEVKTVFPFLLSVILHEKMSAA